MPTERLMLIGAGGHARVVLDALLSGAASFDLSVYTEDAAEAGGTMLGWPIVRLDLARASGAHFHVAIGNNGVRQRLHETLVLAGALPLTLAHPRASVSQFAVTGGGCFIAAGGVVGPGAELGAAVIVNHNAVVDHDCHVSEFAHVAPNASLGGGVRIGPRTLIGAGANILPTIGIGGDAKVGAGAVVTRAVSEGQVVTGIPARRTV